MNKYALFFAILVIMNISVFGQYFDYVSLGYNTIETTRSDGGVTIKYLLLDNPLYSKLAIYTYGLPQPTLMFEENDGKYIHVRYVNQDMPDYSYTEMEEGYYFLNKHEIWRMENNRLIYVRIFHDDAPFDYIYRETFAEKIEYAQSALTVYLTDGMIYKYYNIPENELIDIFMAKIVNEMIHIINNVDRYINTADIEIILRNMTPRELAIFRNSIFAKYSYSFQTPNWIEFFNNYIVDYSGKYTNAEVMEQLTDNEKWLLDLIIKYETGENVSNDEIQINEIDIVEIETDYSEETYAIIPDGNDKNSSLGIYIGIGISFFILIIIGFIAIKKRKKTK
jgi:hypothetical protein